MNRGRTSQSRKPRATKKPAAPRRWLVPAAILVFAASAYLFYFLDNLPQAETIGADHKAQVHSRDQLRLHGLAPGEALHLDVRATASVNLSVGGGARLLAAPGPAESRQRSASEMLLRLFNRAPQNLWVSFRLPPESADARPVLILQPVLSDRSYLELTIISPDAPLMVDIGVVPPVDAGERSQIRLSRRTSPEMILSEVQLAVPAATPIAFGIDQTSLAALELRAGDLTALEIGTVADDEFERRWMVCGSARGRILWQRPLPGINRTDCRSGRLANVELSLGNGIEVTPQGTGFVVSDGTPHVWAGFRNLRQNAVVQSLLSALVVGLVGWVILVVRRKLR